MRFAIYQQSAIGSRKTNQDRVGYSYSKNALVMVVAILVSVGLYLAVQWTGRGKFLFERPAWAHVPGTKGSRSYVPQAVPAE